MTAEVVIMNKSAIAMAADSAVTVGGDKVLNTATKIFTLSKHRPVAVMVYGNAEFVGVPWETLVKLFRAELGTGGFPNLDGYAAEFIRFLEKLIPRHDLFGAQRQKESFEHEVRSFFAFIRDTVKKEIEALFSSEGHELSMADVERATANVIAEYHGRCQKAALVDSVSLQEHRRLKARHRRSLGAARKAVFERLPIGRALARQLNEMAVSLFTRDWLDDPDVSGVVIAGYGDNDVFPRLRAFEFVGVLGGVLCYRRGKAMDVDLDVTANIVPFAQAEMVYRFMEGVDPYYQSRLEYDLLAVWRSSLEAVIDAVEELDSDAKRLYKETADHVGRDELGKYVQRLQAYRQESFVMPVMQVVQALPKDELAELAESLVNLTSLKRKVSGEKETVGGPIDVAVISKGDGLVWIRRKHYFRPELNPQFFANYNREVER